MITSNAILLYSYILSFRMQILSYQKYRCLNHNTQPRSLHRNVHTQFPNLESSDSKAEIASMAGGISFPTQFEGTSRPATPVFTRT